MCTLERRADCQLYQLEYISESYRFLGDRQAVLPGMHPSPPFSLSVIISIRSTLILLSFIVILLPPLPHLRYVSKWPA